MTINFAVKSLIKTLNFAVDFIIKVLERKTTTYSFVLVKFQGPVVSLYYRFLVKQLDKYYFKFELRLTPSLTSAKNILKALT